MAFDPVTTEGTVDAFADAVDDGAVACSTNGVVCAGTLQIASCSADCIVLCTDIVISQVDARQRCTIWGGRLLSIESVGEDTCIDAAAGNTAVWLGLEQVVGQSAPSVGWSWNSDGLPPGYLGWGVGQPNDGDGTEDDTEQCVYMASNGNWHDELCDPTGIANSFGCRRP